MDYGKVVVNTAVIAGMGQFRSIFQRIVGNSGWGYGGNMPRGYTTTRGILISRETVRATEVDFSEALYFQFNPAEIQDVKSALYEVRPYPGLSYNDYIWNGGGERIINFQLFLDNTPQSKTVLFRPDAYNSVQAKTIKPQSSTLEFEGDAFSSTRVNERGIMPDVDKIMSFLNPAKLQGENTPRFAEGGIVSTVQFRPPDVVVFALGPIYMEGFIKSAPVTYQLFDVDLTPIRATVDIEFAVIEYTEAPRGINWEGKLTK